jgi:hypothetical protein
LLFVALLVLGAAKAVPVCRISVHARSAAMARMEFLMVDHSLIGVMSPDGMQTRSW